MTSSFVVNTDHKRWARSAHRKYGNGIQFFLDLIVAQSGKCALTKVPLLFNTKNGTPKKGGPGVYPIYASVDHINPSKDDRLQIICYDINDLKAHLPVPLFSALIKTKEWKKFVNEWKKIAQLSITNRKKFKQLIKKGAPL